MSRGLSHTCLLERSLAGGGPEAERGHGGWEEAAQKDASDCVMPVLPCPKKSRTHGVSMGSSS